MGPKTRWLAAGAALVAIGTAAVELFPGPQVTASAAATKITLPKVTWKKTKAYEFTGKGFPSGWRAITGNGTSGWSHKALQYYQAGNAARNGKGQLVITAAKTSSSSPLKCWNGRCLYTAARIQTDGRFAQKYGRFAIRAKLPTGQGSWPAFWMQHASPYGELDVIETIGRMPKTVQGWAHDAVKRRGGGKVNLSRALSAGYHTYGVDWTPSRVVWWVDGKPYAQMKHYKGWAFSRPFYLILSLQVGGTWPGSPTAKTVFPQRMYVDWIRVYKAA
jgi:beta-glucanase (GH16 family)